MSTIKSSSEHLTLNADGASKDIKFQANGVEKVIVKSDGSVGVGTSSPDTVLTVEGTSGHISANIRCEDGYNSTLGFSDASGNWYESYVRYHTDTNNMSFAVNDSEKLRIQSGGGISFNGDTAAANALDDYEEGTWTPTIRDLGGNLATLSTANGSYTKIGRWVQINFKITLSSKGSMTGNYVLMGGLPFNHPTESYNGTGVIDTWNNFATSYSGLWWDTSSTSSAMWLTSTTSATGNSMPNVAALNNNSHMKGSCMYQISV